jgi:hypothetical protein
MGGLLYLGNGYSSGREVNPGRRNVFIGSLTLTISRNIKATTGELIYFQEGWVMLSSGSRR